MKQGSGRAALGCVVSPQGILRRSGLRPRQANSR